MQILLYIGKKKDQIYENEQLMVGLCNNPHLLLTKAALSFYNSDTRGVADCYHMLSVSFRR